MTLSNATPIKLIYILGEGFSGSTLLDLLIGTHTEIVSIGELHMYRKFFSQHPRKYPDTNLCTCGEDLLDCKFWSEVRAEIQNKVGTDKVDITPESQDLFDQINVPAIQMILKIAGKHWVCDSSKRSHRLSHYLASEHFDPYIIHLIRDSRAVVNSKRKRGRDNLMRVALRWTKKNISLYYQYRRNSRYILIHYEDLSKDPGKTLEKIFSSVGLSYQPNILTAWNSLVRHNLGGNMMRFTKNQSIKTDTSYLSNLPPYIWNLTTLLSLPALILFGYPLSRKIR